jgi:hypothetical protein
MLLLQIRDSDALTKLLANRSVLAVYPDEKLSRQPLRSLPLISQPAVSSAGYRGAGSATAVIDSGVDYTRSDFVGVTSSYGGETGGYGLSLSQGAQPSTCTPNSVTLCLNGGRFRVQVEWRVRSQSRSGSGTAAPLSSDTGYFWFFSSGNVELVVKVLDGRVLNNKFWVFYGALSDVEYNLTVTDTATGAVRVYANPEGRLASVADTSAF